MTVKFKIGFTVDAQTMFEMIAKFLPIDALSVEEVVERPPQPKLMMAHSQPQLAPRPKLAEFMPKGRKKRPPKPVDLDRGINKIILDMLSDGKPRTPAELKAAIAAGKYSPNSLGSRMGQLVRDGYVMQPDYGLYQKGKNA